MDDEWKNPAEQSAEMARIQFPEFYIQASELDETLMDIMVHIHAGLRNCLRAQRGSDDRAGGNLEVLTTRMEIAFLSARAAVKACATFHALPVEAQDRIAAALFSPYISDE